MLLLNLEQTVEFCDVGFLWKNVCWRIQKDDDKRSEKRKNTINYEQRHDQRAEQDFKERESLLKVQVYCAGNSKDSQHSQHLLKGEENNEKL